MAWQEQGSFSSLDDWDSESKLKREEGKEAPKAELDEDIDLLEPGVEVSSLQENQGISIVTIIDATIMELAGNTECKLKEVAKDLPRQVKEIEEEHEGTVALCEEAFPPPPALNSILCVQSCDVKDFSSFECIDKEPTREGEVILNPTQEDINSPSSHDVQEWRNMPDRIEPVDQEEYTLFNEIIADEATAEEEVTQMDFLPENICCSQAESLSESANSINSNINSSDEENLVDNDQEENDVSPGFVFCDEQLGTQDMCNNTSQSSHCLSYNKEPKSTQHASPSVQQQEETLSQSQNELVPRGQNQETAQQVHSQGFPPLSKVAMELSNQSEAASYNSGCVAALGEGHGKAEGRTEQENVQTNEEMRQREGGFEKKEPITQEGEGLLRYSQTEKYRCGVSHEKESHAMGNDSWDKSQTDNGVSTEFSSFCPVEDSTCTSSGMTAAIANETPIEREIRRAIEREHSLRRARGLPTPPTSPLYVEIPLRTNVPSKTLASNAEPNQDKDRELAGKMMQHEIHEELQREQDLVKLGKVPGVYDKGTIRQLKERKLIFEAFQTPSNSTLSTSTKSKASSLSSDSEVSTPGNQEDLPQASSIEVSSFGKKQNQDILSTTHLNSARGERRSKPVGKGPGFSEGTGFQVIILENDLTIPAQKSYQSEASPNPVVNSGKTCIPSFREEEEKADEPKENPFFKLRSSDTFVKVKQDIQETEEREKELRHQRISLYGGMRVEGGKERPIHKKNDTSKSSVPPINGQKTHTPALSFNRAPPTAHHSVGTSTLRLPANTEERERTFSENTCNPRQKTPLVQQWESGLINGPNKEDE